MSAMGLADKVARATVAQVSYRTGVNDIDIGDRVKVALLEASKAHLVTDGIGIGLVNFAAQGGDGECRFCLCLIAHKVLSFSALLMVVFHAYLHDYSLL